MIDDFYRKILDTLTIGLYVVNADRKILFWNKKAEEITGFTAKEAIGEYCHSNFLCHIDEDANPLCLTNCPVHATLEDGEVREQQVFLRHKQGYRISVIVTSSPLYDDEGKIVGVVETFAQNSTEFYSDGLVNSLTRLIMTDKLTGLYNRRYAQNFLEAKIQETQYKEKYCGFLFLDLDDFSNCNNTYGHEVGDDYLRKIATNVTEQIRKSDIFSRWGGEEFIGAFDLDFPGQVALIAEKIRQIVEETGVYTPQGRRIQGTASIGATVIQNDDTVESLVARGDKLMYESKLKGKNRVTVG